MAPRIVYITRPAKRQQAILRAMRGQILAGRYRPGDRLPTHRELENRYRAGRRTIERALGMLEADGFVVPRGRAGTFVADRPPHHARHALVFPAAPGQPGWSHFHHTLLRVAGQYDHNTQSQIVCYFGNGIDGLGYPELLSECAAHRLAGVIFTPTMESFAGTPLADGSMPSVQIGGSGPGRVTVALDYGSLLEQAVGRLAQRGRRRIAVIALDSTYRWVHDALQPALDRHRLTVPRRWVQSIANANTGWLHNCLELILRGEHDLRPDALILLDDNLVSEATEALTDLGVRVPEDLDVVAHANFPWPTPSRLPLFRIGFDLQQTLETCLLQLDRMRRNQSVSARVNLRATPAPDGQDAFPLE